jgi:ribonuclease E
LREPGETAGAEPHVAEAPRPDELAEEPQSEPTRRRRRRGRKELEPELAASPVEPDSSPIVERPIEDEPSIAEMAPAENAKPKARRRKPAAPVTEIAVPEPAPSEAAPAEAVAEAPPAKPVRKSRAKAAAKPAADETKESEAIPMPAANNDTATAEEVGEARRGWWQKTFG